MTFFSFYQHEKYSKNDQFSNFKVIYGWRFNNTAGKRFKIPPNVYYNKVTTGIFSQK